MSEREIFLEALELPTPEARTAFLDRACAGDAQLRQNVDELLHHHYSEDALLAGAAVDLPGSTVDAGKPAVMAEVPGRMLGRYELVEKIGEGGFGEVWLAEQRESVRRRVALKIVKPGMDSRQVLARFEAERQALAMMEHPNIARIIDAGMTDGGRPYFVMELVRGLRITDYCDRNQLTTRERLELFIKVCRAIQHAHQKGVIHRDIKPSNILVTVQDGVPVSKVIDFGIAKATQQELTDKSLHTQFHQFIGTPAYISPEQAGTTGLDIDTRSDIYSLGVLLYELLVGQTPLDPKEMLKGGLDGLRRGLREGEPLSPSTRLGTFKDDVRTTAARCRQTDPVRLVHQLEGDLDWIVMKCLEKDRARRYDTANGLAMDIQRHLDSEPVVARPPSLLYRLEKLIRRNRLAFAAGTVATLALLLGGVGILLFQYRSNRDYRHRLYRSEISRAGLAWQSGQTEQMRTLLSNCPPNLRHWEWEFLHQQTDRWEKKVLLASTNLGQVVLSADASRMVVVNRGVIQVRQVSSGDWLRDFPGVGHPRSVLALSPRGDLLAVSGNDGSVSVWNTYTGERLGGMENDPEGTMTWSRDGLRLALAGNAPRIRFWNADTRQEERSFAVPARVTALAFSPDNRVLAVGTVGWNIELLDTATGEVRRTLRTRGPDYMHLSFSPDGSQLAAANRTLGGFRRDSRVWSLSEDAGSLDLTAGSEVNGLCFSSDGRRLAVGDVAGVIRIWDLNRRAEVDRIAANRILTSAIQWLPDDRILAVSEEGICTWQTAHPGVITLSGYPASLRTAAFSPDSRWLAGSGLSSNIVIWDTQGGRLAAIYAKHPSQAPAVAFGRNGLMVSTDVEGHLRLWNPSTLETLWVSNLDAPNPWWLAFSPDDRRIYALSHRDALTVFDAETGRPLNSIRGLGDILDGLAVSPDGRMIAVGRRVKLSVLHADDLREVWTVPAKPFRCATFTPDGHWLATGDTDGAVSLWEVETAGRTKLSLRGHTGNVSGVGFHPDGTRLVTCGSDGLVKVWDWQAGVELLTLDHPGGGQLWHTAFSPDGKLIFAAGGDGRISLWKVD